jgi:endonuclease/exonuclease/phosphatase family metal-dependent hydrolase
MENQMSGIDRRVLIALPFLLSVTAVQAEPLPITVMTQNLYVGAETLPLIQAQTPAQLATAAVEAFTDVIQNNFLVRAGEIANQVELAGAPLLIGLQEASIINASGTIGTLSLDYTQILLTQLAAQGLNYEVVGTNSYNTTLSALGSTFNITDQDVVLARTDVAGFNVTGVETVDYDAQLTVSTALFGTLTSERGYVAVDATLNGTEFQFVNTHLEALSPTIREQQAIELINDLSGDNTPTILVGDFNATPDQSTY